MDLPSSWTLLTAVLLKQQKLLCNHKHLIKKDANSSSHRFPTSLTGFPLLFVCIEANCTSHTVLSTHSCSRSALIKLWDDGDGWLVFPQLTWLQAAVNGVHHLAGFRFIPPKVWIYTIFRFSAENGKSDSRKSDPFSRSGTFWQAQRQEILFSCSIQTTALNPLPHTSLNQARICERERSGLRV